MIGAKLFDTSMNLKNIIINIETVSRMNEVELTQMLHSFNHYGFAILQCIQLNHFALDFLLLSKIFGKPTRHNRADDRGIVPIRPLPGYQAYLGASNEQLVRLQRRKPYLSRFSPGIFFQLASSTLGCLASLAV
ncbi:hypothetical protein [Brasilonema bromeliae]|uniref:Uncharacterized protein n=1 Tax=Brasilonema bromeliae SPC951 TaxID=385972 RepID=A0ABX1P5N3_9CYAN|nr:hypothetical protein [Brasilonema bromeliae]NMG18935.1 hypothetical protein [Brasilonema bromeliae SPC951]